MLRALNLKNMLVKPKILSDDILIYDSKLFECKPCTMYVPKSTEILVITKSCWSYFQQLSIKK